MAPKKVGKKKDEVVELPKTSSLPDGAKTYFVGGWSAYHTLHDISAITERVRPTTPEDEITAAVKQLYVLPGVMGTAKDSFHPTLCHGMLLTGLSPNTTRANAAAYDAKKAASAAGGAAGDGDGGAAAGDGEGDAAANTAAASEAGWAADVDDSVVVASTVTLEGVRPTVTVAPVVVDVKPSAAPEKGAKKKSEEEKQRELEAQRQREEAAIQAAKAEEARLNKFAMPNRWAAVVISNLVFTGPVKVRQLHVQFKNCRFACSWKNVNQVEVAQYCRVSFTNCTFEGPRKASLYCFPLAEVTVKKCTFTGSSDAAAHETNSIGVHTDGAKITVDHCQFTKLGTGVLLRGSVAPAAAAPSGDAAGGDAAEKGNTLKPAASTQIVQSSKFYGLFTSGYVCDKASYTLFHRNEVQDCGYYGAQVLHGGVKNFLMTNNFSSLVHIGSGATPVLNGNTMSFPIKNDNDASNVYMQPVY